MSESSKPSLPDDIDWIAYQYVEGLLSSEEAAAFEERLGDDSAAQESLIRTVELLDCLRVIGMTEVGASDSAQSDGTDNEPIAIASRERSESAPWFVEHWRGLSIALSLGLVAVTLIVIGFGGNHRRGDQQAENQNSGNAGLQTKPVDVDEQDVIFGWVESSQTLAAFQGQSEAEPNELSLVPNEIPDWLARLDADENAQANDTELEAEPDWMVLALESMTFEDESIDGLPSDEQIQ